MFINHKLTRIPKFTCLILIGVLAFYIPGISQELSVDFEEQLAIGDQKNAPKEYLFGGPKFIRTDSEGRIYVATMNNSIRVFSPEGEYLKNIGRRGRGPGEFLEITGIAIGLDDELIVYDRRMMRLARFYDFGDSLYSQNLKHPDWTGDDIVPLANEKFASVAISPAWLYEFSDELEAPNYEDMLIHVLDGETWTKTHSIFNVYEHMQFYKEDPLEADFAMTGPYHLAKLNDSTLIITHQISNGSLYLVNINNDKTREIKGNLSREDSYKLFSWERRDYFRDKLASIVIASASPNTSSAVYQIKLWSRTVLTNNKWGLNFLQLAADIDEAEENKSDYYIDFIDGNGNYLGYTKIDDDFTTRIENTVFFPKHLDNKNQLYYTDYTSGIPVIRVTKIIMEK